MCNLENISIKLKTISLSLLLWSSFLFSQNIYDTAIVDTVALKYKKLIGKFSMGSSRVLRLGVGFKPRTPPPSRPPRSPSSLNRLSEAKRAKPGKPGVSRPLTMQRSTGTKDAGTPADSLSPSLESDRHRIYFGVRWPR